MEDRTAKQKISILLPTRKRTQLVKNSLSSLLSKAKYPERIELCIAYDDDDEMSDEFFSSDEWSEFVKDHKCSVQIHETVRYGYLGLFRYVNLLAEASTGDWVMFWNDDAVMETDDWDTRIDDNKDYFGCLRMPCTTMNHPFALFPIIPKKWCDLFGTVSLVNHSDWWIYNVCKPVNRIKDIDVFVAHNRADVNGENNDEVFNENSYALDGRDPSNLDDYSHPQRIKDRQHWTSTLMLHGYPHVK